MKTKVKVQNCKKVLITFVAAALILLSMFTLAACDKKAQDVGSSTASTVSEEAKTSITFKVIKDGETTSFELKTAKKYLGEALAEAGIVDYSNDGYYTTIHGITADYSKDKSWWCVTIGGVMSNYGMNQIELVNGGVYEVTYTIG